MAAILSRSQGVKRISIPIRHPGIPCTQDSQYYGCLCHGYWRNHGISSRGVDLELLGYPVRSTGIVLMVYIKCTQYWHVAIDTCVTLLPSLHAIHDFFKWTLDPISLFDIFTQAYTWHCIACLWHFYTRIMLSIWYFYSVSTGFVQEFA